MLKMNERDSHLKNREKANNIWEMTVCVYLAQLGGFSWAPYEQIKCKNFAE